MESGEVPLVQGLVPALAGEAEGGLVVDGLLGCGRRVAEFEGLGDDERIAEGDEELDEFAIHRPGVGGELPAEFFEGELLQGWVWKSVPGKAQFDDAELEEKEFLGEGIEGPAGEAAEEGGLVGGVPDAGEGEEGAQAGEPVGLGKGPILPGGGGQVFEGDAGGVTQGGIGRGQNRPEGVDPGGIRFSGESGQFAALESGLGLRPLGFGNGGDGFGVGVAETVQAGLDAAAAGDEVERAIRADSAVGEVEGPTLDDRFQVGHVGSADGTEVEGEDAAEAPIEGEQGPLVALGEAGAGAEGDAGGGTQADIGDTWEGIGVISGPFAGAFTEPVIDAGEAMEDPVGPVPGEAPVAFHVAVEGEELAVGVEGDVVGIAEAGGEEFGFGAIWVHAEDEAARWLAAGSEPVPVVDGREGEVDAGIPEGRMGGEGFGDVNEVAVDDVEVVAIGDDAMGSVFSLALPGEEGGAAVEGVVLVGVLETVEGGAVGAAAIDVEAVEGPCEAHGGAGGGLDPCEVGEGGVVGEGTEEGFGALG